MIGFTGPAPVITPRLTQRVAADRGLGQTGAAVLGLPERLSKSWGKFSSSPGPLASRTSDRPAQIRYGRR